MTYIRRRTVETSETAKERIEFLKSTLRKNGTISIIIGSIVLFLLLLFCYIRYKYGRAVQTMTRTELEKRKGEFRRVLEPEEIEERKQQRQQQQLKQQLKQQQRERTNRDGRNGNDKYECLKNDTMTTSPSYESENITITESNEEGDCMAIEVAHDDTLGTNKGQDSFTMEEQSSSKRDKAEC